MNAAPTRDTVRVDVWLWRTRFFKTRALATAFVGKGKVRVSRPGKRLAAVKASFAIAPGDVLTFARRQGVMCVEVLGLGVRRGPAVEARALYAVVSPANGATSESEETSL